MNKPQKYIRRGTTPKQTFKHIMWDNLSDMQELIVTYVQKDKIIIEKRKDDITIDDEHHMIWFRLTQEDTLALDPKLPVEIQLRGLTLDENAVASDIISVPVKRILNEEVLGEDPIPPEEEVPEEEVPDGE